MLAVQLNFVAQLIHTGPQEGVLDRADNGVVGPDLVGVKRLPFAVRHARHVGDDGMDVQLRIEGPARVVLEEGVDQIAGLNGRRLAIDGLATFGEVFLDPCHRILDRLRECAVRSKDALVTGYVGHDRD